MHCQQLLCQVTVQMSQNVNLVGCDIYRGRGATYKGMPLGRASTGRIVDWKPPGKETPQQPAKSGSQAHTASKDPKPSEQTPATSRLSPDGVCLCLSLCLPDTVSAAPVRH